MKRLKSTEVKEYREQQWKIQNGICPLCMQYMEPDKTVLDHCHKTSLVRKAIHGTCNLLLGKWENALKRYGIDEIRANNIAMNIIKYSTDVSDILHSTFKTPEEKKALLAKRRKRKKNGKI